MPTPITFTAHLPSDLSGLLAVARRGVPSRKPRQPARSGPLSRSQPSAPATMAAASAIAASSVAAVALVPLDSTARTIGAVPGGQVIATSLVVP